MRKKKSAILEAVHETATDLHKAGVMNQTTLREFERLCLTPIESLEPNQIKEIRESSQVSQAWGKAIGYFLVGDGQKNEYKYSKKYLQINSQNAKI